MLLIALPKSASTSLAVTIAKIGGLKCNLGIPKKDGDLNCKGFKTIQKKHNNMVSRSPEFIHQIIKGRKTLFKEHLLPTKEHLETLDKYRGNIVILLRDSEHALDSYKRLGCKITKGLEKDLNDFHNKYMWWASNKRNALVIYYKDLVLDYVPTIKRVLKHYKIEHKKIIGLLKRKFTKVGIDRLKHPEKYIKEEYKEGFSGKLELTKEDINSITGESEKEIQDGCIVEDK